LRIMIRPSDTRIFGILWIPTNQRFCNLWKRQVLCRYAR